MQKTLYQSPIPYNYKLFPTTSKHGYNELDIILKDDETSRETRHATVALDDILKPDEDGKPVQFVLIEGTTGTGKSTLAWQMCHKWAREELK